MAIIKFDKKKLVDFIERIKSDEKGYRYALMGEWKYKRRDTGKFGAWHYIGWSLPDKDEDYRLKEVRTKDKYKYYIMFSKSYIENDGYVRETQQRYELRDEWLEALGIERRQR